MQGKAKGLFFMSETGNSTPTDKPEANGALILQGHSTTVFCKNNCWKKQESTRVFYSLSKANNF